MCYTLGEDIFLCNGGIFVCGFFAMSGYLNFNSYQQTPSPLLFAKKRFRRIYPAYSLTIILCTLMGAFISTLPFTDYFADFTTWRYLLYNLIFLNYMQPTLPQVFDTNALTVVNASLWTMKIEVLFYLTVPLVHWLIRQYGSTKILLTIILFSLLYNYATYIAFAQTNNPIYYTMNHQLPGELVYFYTPVLMLQHMEWVRRHGRVLLLAASVLIVPFFFDNSLDWLHPISIPVFVVTFAYECKWLLPTARWIDFSYEFYLFRFPVLQTIIFLGWATTLPEVALIALPLIFAIAIPLHYLSKQISDAMN